MSDHEHADLTQRLREYHAARNSLERATAELEAALPPGTIVLQRTAEQADTPSTVYWAYWAPEQGHGMTWGIHRNDGATRAIIVVAPAPRAEFLPRLGEARP